MYKNKKILAIIPARGRSKRIPHKNIRPLLGKPLIVWTIEQAKKSRYLDGIVVSTDDARIADIAKKNGVKVPFMRPKELSRDDSSTVDVVIHALKWFSHNGKAFDAVVILQPTSPLRISGDIDKAVGLFFSKKAKTVVSVCRVAYHPYWMSTLSADGRMHRFINNGIQNLNKRKLPIFYQLNGALYVVDSDYVIRHQSLFEKKTLAYIMPQHRSVDIDEEIDFYFAEYLLKRFYSKKYKRP